MTELVHTDSGSIDGQIDLALRNLSGLTGEEYRLRSVVEHHGTPDAGPGRVSTETSFYTVALRSGARTILGEGDTVGQALSMAISREANHWLSQQPINT